MDGINYEGITVRLHNDKMDCWLDLPVKENELRNALTEMDALDGSFTIDRCRDGLGGRLESFIIGSSLADVHYLAARIEETEPRFPASLAAVLDSPERFPDIRRLIDYTYNENYFDLIPNVHSAEDLARYYIHDSGFIQMPEEWAEGIELQRFGENLDKHEGGHYTEHGYLILTGTEWVSVYEAFRVIPGEYALPQFYMAQEINAPQMPPVYSRSFDYAREHGELDAWRENKKHSTSCAHAIDQAVNDSNYELYHYDLKTAAESVIAEYGAERVAHVLADILQHQKYDGRYSSSNKQWAQAFGISDERQSYICNTHPAVLDGFVRHTRQIIEELEKHNPLAAVEMSSEQNCNMIDGLINNLAVPKADLTDGQTLDEIRELAPETLPESERSVVERIREARDNPIDREKCEKKHSRSHDERQR